MRVYWEITTKCNIRCDYCFYRQYNNFSRSLSTADVKNAISVLESVKPTHLVLTGGEPALEPNLSDTVGKVRKGIPQVQIRIITAASGSLVAIEDCARLRFIDAVTVSDHQPEGRTKRLSFIEDIARYVDVNVIIPIHRFRLRKCRDIVRQYLNAGCNEASFNVLVFADNTDPRSLIHCSKTEQDELLSIAQTEAGDNAFMSLKNQLCVLQPRFMVNSPCKAAFDFVFLDADGKVTPCPYWSEDKAPVLPFKHNNNRQLNRDDIKFLQLKRVMTKCRIHAGCVCINGKLEW